MNFIRRRYYETSNIDHNRNMYLFSGAVRLVLSEIHNSIGAKYAGMDIRSEHTDSISDGGCVYR